MKRSSKNRLRRSRTALHAADKGGDVAGNQQTTSQRDEEWRKIQGAARAVLDPNPHITLAEGRDNDYLQYQSHAREASNPDAPLFEVGGKIYTDPAEFEKAAAAEYNMIQGRQRQIGALRSLGYDVKNTGLNQFNDFTDEQKAGIGKFVASQRAQLAKDRAAAEGFNLDEQIQKLNPTNAPMTWAERQQMDRKKAGGSGKNDTAIDRGPQQSGQVAGAGVGVGAGGVFMTSTRAGYGNVVSRSKGIPFGSAAAAAMARTGSIDTARGQTQASMDEWKRRSQAMRDKTSWMMSAEGRHAAALNALRDDMLNRHTNSINSIRRRMKSLDALGAFEGFELPAEKTPPTNESFDNKAPTADRPSAGGASPEGSPAAKSSPVDEALSDTLNQYNRSLESGTPGVPTLRTSAQVEKETPVGPVRGSGGEAVSTDDAPKAEGRSPAELSPVDEALSDTLNQYNRSLESGTPGVPTLPGGNSWVATKATSGEEPYSEEFERTLLETASLGARARNAAVTASAAGVTAGVAAKTAADLGSRSARTAYSRILRNAGTTVKADALKFAEQEMGRSSAGRMLSRVDDLKKASQSADAAVKRAESAVAKSRSVKQAEANLAKVKARLAKKSVFDAAKPSNQKALVKAQRALQKAQESSKAVQTLQKAQQNAASAKKAVESAQRAYTAATEAKRAELATQYAKNHKNVVKAVEALGGKQAAKAAGRRTAARFAMRAATKTMGPATLALGGLETAGTQGYGLYKQAQSLGAGWRDVGSAAADVFTTKRGWRNLGLGLLGSTADVLSSASFGLFPNGDSVRAHID